MALTMGLRMHDRRSRYWTRSGEYMHILDCEYDPRVIEMGVRNHRLVVHFLRREAKHRFQRSPFGKKADLHVARKAGYKVSTLEKQEEVSAYSCVLCVQTDALWATILLLSYPVVSAT